MGGRKRESADEVEARLQRGDWLTAGAVAILLGVDRGTVVNWIRKGRTPTGLQLRHRPNSLSGYRECDPADVAAILKAKRNPADGC